ncbi:L-serine ammonia-lyase, iron-sulfur-dependent, subunit alpha [Staphylococcus kloosii]|jgi:L-serine dehydratase|nr:L-serine ammonia-lyase, iron-sulfur-dependent, subunit alpha [Staphylococcus kloosii]
MKGLIILIKKQKVSIFNEVLGPIMSGPSSSHTAGPTRIGKMCYDLMNGDIDKVHIQFDKNGSFASTYRGQKSDRGFAAGILGFNPEDENLASALEIAKENNIEISFEITSFPANHPNTAKINLVNSTEQKNVTALSTGGGMVSIIAIDDVSIEINGDLYDLLIDIEAGNNDLKQFVHKIKSILDIEIFDYKVIKSNEQQLLHIKTRNITDNEQAINMISSLATVVKVKIISPVLPVLSSKDIDIPFESAKDIQSYGRENNLKLWEVALVYEMRRSGWDKTQVFEKMAEIMSFMRKSIKNGLNEELNMLGFLKPKARYMKKEMETNKTVPSGVLEEAIIWATAIMEYNSSMGVVVAAPTAGSCGVLPSIILSTADALELDLDKQIKAMLSAGIIGVLIAENATFAAEVGGCQAEIGSSTGMAAAGLIELLDGTIDQSFRASAMALQNILGLICDPVAGVVDIPCINRNSMGISNAVVSSNMAMMGFDPVIPLDEVIKAMKEVGDAMPTDLKCTGCGGLCTTETAKNISLNF